MWQSLYSHSCQSINLLLYQTLHYPLDFAYLRPCFYSCIWPNKQCSLYWRVLRLSRHQFVTHITEPVNESPPLAKPPPLFSIPLSKDLASLEKHPPKIWACVCICDLRLTAKELEWERLRNKHHIFWSYVLIISSFDFWFLLMNARKPT